MADMAKYGEVKMFAMYDDDGDRAINELLANGWELITAKIVEVQFQNQSPSPALRYMKKVGQFYYVLGKRRDYKTPEQQEASRKTLHESLE